MDYTSVPTPLTMTIDRVRNANRDTTLDPWGIANFFEVTTPQYPNLCTRSSNLADAVAELARHVLYAQPMAQEVVDSLRNAGYTPDVIAAWDEETRFLPNRDYRSIAEIACSTLDAYTSAGVPALTACAMVPLLDPVHAGLVHAAGCTPQDVRAYADLSDTEKWYHEEFDIMPWLLAGLPAGRGALYVDTYSVEEAIAWEAVAEQNEISDHDLRGVLRLGLTPEVVAFGFPVHRAAFYIGCGASAESAVAWESVSDEHKIDDRDLCDIVRAGFVPDNLLEHSEAGVEPGRSLAKAARMLLGLTAHHSSPNPWRVEPPF